MCGIPCVILLTSIGQCKLYSQAYSQRGSVPYSHLEIWAPSVVYLSLGILSWILCIWSADTEREGLEYHTGGYSQNSYTTHSSIGSWET